MRRRLVAAEPRTSAADPLTELEFSVDELHVAGDAVRARNLHNAVHEGYRLGLRV